MAMNAGYALPGSRIGKPLPLVKLVDNFDASYSYVANEGSVFTFLTNLNAPLYRCELPIRRLHPSITWG